jgi:methyl-accepting chemotaxis protein
MEATADKITLQETAPPLQLKRHLLPIDEYAAREGVSRGIIEECGKLGIIQIRRYKGETFVVDVPLSQYASMSESTAESGRLTDNAAQAQKISELVKEVIPESFDITNELTESVNEIRCSEEVSEPIQTPELQTLEMAAGPAELIDETVQADETPELVRVPQSNEFSLDAFMAAQARSKRIWKIAALSSIAVVFVVLFACFWLYLDRRVQLDKLEEAYARVQQSIDESTQANQRTEIFQDKLANTRTQIGRLKSELDSSRAEAGRLKGELNNARTQVESVLDELTEAEQNFNAIQRHNAESLQQLKGQIRKLSDQLPELVEMR